MNLLEALKGNLPIGRRAWRGQARWEWYDPKTLLDLFERGDLRPWSREDLLADDWEFKETAVVITPSEFWRAVDRYRNIFWPDPAAQLLAEALGLEKIK